MTPKERAAMQQALEALEFCKKFASRIGFDAAITALREALAEQAEQEPVAFQMICPRCKVDRVTTPCPRGGVSDCPMTATAQNAAPVRTKDLTDEEIEDVCCRLWSGGWRKKAMNDFARAVITKFKEKNK